MAGKLPKPAYVDAANIQRPNVDQTAAEEQKALAEIRRKIREHTERKAQEMEEEAVKQYISHFSVDRQGNVKKDKDVVIDIPALKVQSNAPLEVNSEIANFIDGAVSASFNNKFVAMGEKFESTIKSRLEHLEAKFDKQFSGKDVNGSTSNTENYNASEDLSNLHIPKVPIGSSPVHHIHSRTTIGTSAGGVNTMAATNAMMPHTVVYNEPSTGAYVSNSSLHHIPNTLPNQTATYSTPQPTLNQVPHPGSSRPRTVSGMEGFREEIIEIFRQTFGTEPKTKSRSYQRPYPENYEYIPYPPGFKIPEFTKFSGDDGRSTLEHIGQFTIQCGEAASNDICKMRLFPLSLSGAAFTWFISLPPNSVYTFANIESKFHDYFFNGETELKLSNLVSVKQKSNESVSEYIRRFRDTRNRCYSLTISDRDLADLAYAGLLDIHKDKLDGQEFLDVSRLMQKALANENRLKESKSLQKTNDKSNRLVYYASDNSDDESNNVYSTEFVWSAKDKPTTCDSLKPVRKNRQEEVKYTFDVAKCERIFDELLKAGKIRITHTMPPLEELKRRAYCKFHNSYSHATNDCNVFRRQVQSAIDEGRLTFHPMQVDTNPFPMNTIELRDPKVLIRPHQAEKAVGKNVIIGDDKLSDPEVIKVQKEVPQVLGGQQKTKKTGSAQTGLTGSSNRSDRFLQKSWECSKHKKKVKPTFEELLAKYKKKSSSQKQGNRPSKGITS